MVGTPSVIYQTNQKEDDRAWRRKRRYIKKKMTEWRQKRRDVKKEDDRVEAEEKRY